MVELEAPGNQSQHTGLALVRSGGAERPGELRDRGFQRVAGAQLGSVSF